jgi:hypothetical protein
MTHRRSPACADLRASRSAAEYLGAQPRIIRVLTSRLAASLYSFTRLSDGWRRMASVPVIHLLLVGLYAFMSMSLVNAQQKRPEDLRVWPLRTLQGFA